VEKERSSLSYGQIKRCLFASSVLPFATLAAMPAVCEIFNLLHFRSTAQRGGGMAQVAQW